MNSTKTTITQKRRVGRTFGYLGIFVVWALILAIVIGVLAIIPIAISNLPDGLQYSKAVTSVTDDRSQILPFIIAIPLVTSIFGYAMYALILLPLANAMLALAYFFRSFSPKYKNEPLSMTRWTSEGIGTIRLGFMAGLYPGYENRGSGTAISLLPVQKSQFTTFWATISLLTMSVPKGVKGFWTLVYGVALINLAYFVTISWYYWPVREPMLVLMWVLISVALFIYGLVIVIRISLKRVAQWNEETPSKKQVK